MALTGAGLICLSVPASPASTDVGGDSPNYSGFFHCLAVFDDQHSRVLTRVGPWFIPCNLYSYLCGYPFANKFIAEIYLVF